MNRRNFIKSSLGALVGAALIPKIPLALPPSPVVDFIPRVVTTKGGPGAISFEAMERFYNEVSRGKLQPSMGVMNIDQYRRFQKMFEGEVTYGQVKMDRNSSKADRYYGDIQRH